MLEQIYELRLIHPQMLHLEYTLTKEERKILNVHSKVINVIFKELTNVQQVL